jgi:DNA-binding CsgD family transcriptional regulator
MLWNIQAIENAFSDAATNPAVWARALNILTAQTEAFGAALTPVTGNILPNVPLSCRMEETLGAYLQREWQMPSEHVRGAGKIVLADDRVNTDEIKVPHLPLRNFLPTNGLGLCVEINVECGSDLWCLSIRRSLGQRPFSPEEKGKIALIRKSLSSAVAVSRVIGIATTEACVDAFDVSATAVLVFDRFGKVIRRNESAEQTLQGDVRLSRGRLVSKDQNATRVLEQALYKFMQTGEASLAPILIKRDGQRPLLLYFLKLFSLSRNPFSDCQALAILVDPDKRWVPTEMILRATFGFTPAEAKLTSGISSGAPFCEVVERLCISTKTARNQLLQIFAKAGVHSQAELVALVGRLRRWQETLGYQHEDPLKAPELRVGLQQDRKWRDIGFSLSESTAAPAGRVASAGKLPASALRRRDSTIALLRR